MAPPCYPRWMEVRCPRCEREVNSEAVNVAKDLVYCGRCNQVFGLSQLLSESRAMEVRLEAPPPGAWFERTAQGFSLGATTRSPVAFFLVPFMLVWSGGSLGGIYGTQIAKGHFDLFQSLFGLPFLAGSVLFWAITLMAIAGRVSFERRGDVLTLFTGVGPLGWRRRLRWSEVKGVEPEDASARYPGSERQQLMLVTAERRAPIGSGVTKERQHFLENALLRLLAEERRGSTRDRGALGLSSDREERGALSPGVDVGVLSHLGDD